jgi:16S rRNA (guanine966-N2)-methyltransferase
MAREGVFSSLGSFVAGARVLDLYAGTGAMAIEALSRGAGDAVLVERDRAALGAIRTNLERARVSDSARVVARDVGAFLTSDDNAEGPFDLVVVDPPYATPDPRIEALLEDLARSWLSPEGFRIVLTRPNTSSTHVIPVHWVTARRLTYGDTLVQIFREA